MPKTLLTVQQAAAAMGCSTKHIRRLIDEADALKKHARWKWGQELIDLTPKTSLKRMVRVHWEAVVGA